LDSDDYDVLICDPQPSALGTARRVRIHRLDMKPMGFRELWDLFDVLFPGRWAVQVFPPRRVLLDQANKYHLWLLEEEPDGLNLFQS
jgi:hypothetical protein